MKAKVVKAFAGRPDGDPLTRQFEAGAIIEGELAEVAVREKWARRVRPPSAAVGETR